MNKIEKAHIILMNRLPYKYRVPIRIYKTIYTLFREQAKDSNCSYRSLIDYYNRYLSNPKKATYMKTKYWTRMNKRKNPFNTTALASLPIKLAEDNLKFHPLREITFTILHEIGHHVYDSSNERLCDQFAVRWIRKLIKERLIKER